jgi:hypothetical protein
LISLKPRNLFLLPEAEMAGLRPCPENGNRRYGRTIESYPASPVFSYQGQAVYMPSSVLMILTTASVVVSWIFLRNLSFS